MHGIVLTGFMGVGKTTVGRALAQRLSLPFVDTDGLLVQRHGPIALQFARDGEAVFRRRERAVIASLAGQSRSVIATGGGSWIDGRNRRPLRQLGVVVALEAPLAWLEVRLRDDPRRPLAQHALKARYARRVSQYREADVCVGVAGLSVAAIVQRVLDETQVNAW